MKGKFIVVEGLGGSGKTGVTKKLVQFFNEANIPYVHTREPGGPSTAEYLRKLCREGLPDLPPLKPITQVMLFNAARAENVQRVILPALRDGVVVICDRFVDTTFAFQCGAGGVDLGVVETIHEAAHGIYPDMTFLLDGRPEVFLKRISPEEFASDQFDNLQLSKLQAARDMYRFKALENPRRYTVIDAEQSEEQVWAQILPHLQQLKNEMLARPKSTGGEYPGSIGEQMRRAHQEIADQQLFSTTVIGTV